MDRVPSYRDISVCSNAQAAVLGFAVTRKPSMYSNSKIGIIYLTLPLIISKQSSNWWFEEKEWNTYLFLWSPLLTLRFLANNFERLYKNRIHHFICAQYDLKRMTRVWAERSCRSWKLELDYIFNSWNCPKVSLTRCHNISDVPQTLSAANRWSLLVGKNP